MLSEVSDLNIQAVEEEDGAVRRFVIAGRTWMIIDADPEKSELLVVPVSDQAKAPQWVGELPPVPAEVARASWVRLKDEDESIALKELLPNVIACALWGRDWQGGRWSIFTVTIWGWWLW